MRRLLVSVGLTAVLGLAGCGGGDDDQVGTPFRQLVKTYSERFSAHCGIG